MSLLALIVLLGVAGVAAVVSRNLTVFRPAPPPGDDTPALSILIPVRDEEVQVEAAVRAACAQAGEGEVVVLDDGSTDATPEILARLVRELPRLRVVTGQPLPEGWAGKAWACWQLASEHARHGWILFVDSDVRLHPDAARRALAAARAESVPFLTAFPRQITASVGEALLIPLVHLVLLAYLPMWLIRRIPSPGLAAGCGQFILAERAAYLAAGGHRAIRSTLHDGLQLARRMKATGFAIGLLDGTDLATCRMYAGLGAAWRGFSRNAYEALGSPAAVAVMVTLNAALFVLPFVALPVILLTEGLSRAAALWGAAVAAVVGLRAVLAVRFRAPLWIALATPLAVALMIGIYLQSYANARLGRRVTWRSRSYMAGRPIPEAGRAAVRIPD
jgi:hypothetical protein